MGAFIANFHVRSDGADHVRQVLAKFGITDYRISDPRSGWVSVYEERASTQDEAWIERLASDLSARLATACVAFMVHDSDIARYWLCDNGQLLDEYNSMPDYFDSVSAAEKQRVQGQSAVFLRYCRPGITRQQVEAVLRTDVTFAEETISQLAAFLGIDPSRAQEDFGDAGSGGDPGGWGIFDGGEDEDGNGDDDDGGSAFGPGMRAGGRTSLQNLMQQQFQNLLATSKGPAATAPQSDALVQAAANGDLAEIERLVEAGADVNAPGLLSIKPVGASSVIQLAELPKMPASPLIAAASRGMASAAQRLIELGARAADVHPVFGSPLHAAVQSGSPETVNALLAAGVPADIKNAQGQTPAIVLKAIRGQLEMTKNLVKSMPGLENAYDQFLAKLGGLNLPEAGWEACEELLRTSAERV